MKKLKTVFEPFQKSGIGFWMMKGMIIGVKKKIICICAVSAFIFNSAHAATIDSVVMKNGVWYVEGRADNASGVAIKVWGENGDAKTLGLSDLRQGKVKKGGGYSFEIPEIESGGVYTIGVSDNYTNQMTKKTLYLADNEQSGVIYSSKTLGDYSEWKVFGDYGATCMGSGKMRIGKLSQGTTAAVVEGFGSAMDYRLKLEMSAVSAMNAKVLFRYQDEDNYCYLTIPFTVSGGSGIYKMGVVSEGKDTVMYEKKVTGTEAKTGVTYDIVIESVGFWTRAFVNGEFAAKMYDESVTNGTVGAVAENGQIYINNITAENTRETARVGKIDFSDSLGNTVYTVPQSGDVTVSSYGVNITDDEVFEGSLIAAVYEDERLVSVVSDKKIIAPKEREDFKIELSGIKKNQAVKGFLWDGFSLQKPLESGGRIGNMGESVYVDSNYKGDSDGTFEKPYRTITAGLEAVKNIKNSAGLGENGINLFVRGGDYELSDALNISGEEYSGTPMQPVKIEAFEGETVTVRASTRIPKESFAPAEDDRIESALKGKIYAADIDFDVPEIKKFTYIDSGKGFANLIYKGEAQQIAKYPNDGFMKTGAVYNASTGEKINTKTVEYWDNLRKTEKNIYMKVDDSHISKWKNAKNAWLGGYWYSDWSYENARLNSADTAGIFMQIPECFYINDNMDFEIYNLLEELDLPGEWYAEDGKVYFYPPDGTVTEDLYISKNLDNILKINNTHDIKISGITFDTSLKVGIEIISSERVDIENSIVKNAGAAGIVTWYSKNVNITSSEIYNCGANGIMLIQSGNAKTLERGDSNIVNCRIHDCARVERSYTPAISLNGSSGCRAANNTIYNMPHSAIIFSGCELIIENNEIYDVLKEAADAGAIYAGRSYIMRGNAVRNNYLHDIRDRKNSGYTVVGIYLDDMLSGTTVEKNIIDGVDCGIFLNGGRDTVIRNNIIVNKTAENTNPNGEGRYSILMRDTGMFSFRLSDAASLAEDIWTLDLTSKAWQKYPEVADYPKDTPGVPIRDIVENNLIWNHHSMRAYDGYLKYSPLGVNSDNAVDPKFKGNGDYTVGNSEVFEILPDFKNIETDKIGAR